MSTTMSIFTPSQSGRWTNVNLSIEKFRRKFPKTNGLPVISQWVYVLFFRPEKVDSDASAAIIYQSVFRGEKLVLCIHFGPPPPTPLPLYCQLPTLTPFHTTTTKRAKNNRRKSSAWKPTRTVRNAKNPPARA